MSTVIFINFVLFVVFTLCFAYQFFYVAVALFCKPKKFEASKLHKYAVIISARNEQAVIGELLDSLNQQNYPRELFDVFVIADNCTDRTADVAASKGAYVYERNDLTHIGKGYALNFIFKIIYSDYANRGYEGFFVFDADNILDENYIANMNAVFDNGYRIVTSYRNSKNYGDNWLSAASSLWFLREARFLNNARMILGSSCAISGTGFLICDDIVRRNSGWKHNLLTEDIEFTIDSIVHGEKVGYCDDAVLYDEQPVKLKQSARQRLRWAKGFYQVFFNYGGKLFASMFKGAKFSAFDMMMTIAPSMLITLMLFVIDSVAFIYAAVVGDPLASDLLIVLAQAFLGFYGLFVLMGTLTVISEWKKIHCHVAKKILYLLTFPFFMFTYVPISIYALFAKVEWKPIIHKPVAKNAGIPVRFNGAAIEK
ncbi:MAG: glycosyltransferase family 2 protein [Clostridiales bacterium]|nr:glycosyltransferase family 2 protein [Clostridiales bacterium]